MTLWKNLQSRLYPRCYPQAQHKPAAPLHQAAEGWKWEHLDHFDRHSKTETTKQRDRRYHSLRTRAYDSAKIKRQRTRQRSREEKSRC